jgi:hypothetical protein
MSDSSKRGDSDNTDYVVGPTIVGGRPLGNDRPQSGIPRGIEVLVKKASVDPAFRELLLEKRALAASEIGLELSPAEIATLNSVPRSQIEQIIENTTVPDEQRRVFLGKIAAAMLALLGVGLVGCDRGDYVVETGHRPNDPRLNVRQGIRPDLPRPHRSPSDSKSPSPGKGSSEADGEKKESSK